MPDENKSPLDSLVELALYAPLGLALTARDHLPDLVARGRQQLTSQVALARMMGQYAVKEESKNVRRRVADVTDTLRGLGLIPEPNPSPTSPAAANVPAPPPEAEVVVEPAAGSASSSPNGSANGRAAAGSDAPATPEARSRADLAIPGYDTLSASQVVQRLAGLAPEELEAVRDYESATRGRRTILSKVAQLQSNAPSS